MFTFIKNWFQVRKLNKKYKVYGSLDLYINGHHILTTYLINGYGSRKVKNAYECTDSMAERIFPTDVANYCKLWEKGQNDTIITGKASKKYLDSLFEKSDFLYKTANEYIHYYQFHGKIYHKKTTYNSSDDIPLIND